MKLSESQALYRIAAYCSKAERSESDVRKKLEGWELPPVSISNIISQLKKENYLNEERFCRSYIKDKMRFNRWGQNKIVFELKKKQIPSSLIQSVLSEITEENEDSFETNLIQILRTKEKSIKAKNNFDKRNKLIRFALGRGFTMDQILKCLDKYPELSSDETF